MSAKPEISVIVPCYNQAHYLAELLTSVSIATARPHEILIINDGSNKPNTRRHLSEIRPIGAHQSVRVIEKTNGGLSSARNFGVANSMTNVIQFLDADDMLFRDSIDLRLDILRESNSDIAICDFMLCNEERNKFWSPEVPLIQEKNFNFFGVARFWERGLSIPIHCGLFRKSALPSPPFCEELRGKEDWIFWLEIFLKTSRTVHVREPGAVYRMHQANMTRDGRSMAISWLNAIEMAKVKFPRHFDNKCVALAMKHFETFYLNYFWAEGRGYFPISFYETILWRGWNNE